MYCYCYLLWGSYTYCV